METPPTYKMGKNKKHKKQRKGKDASDTSEDGSTCTTLNNIFISQVDIYNIYIYIYIASIVCAGVSLNIPSCIVICRKLHKIENHIILLAGICLYFDYI